MVLLKFLFALGLASVSSFGASFLVGAWRKRKKTDPLALALGEQLPGFDCGLCGAEDCQAYASAVVISGADPGLCSPGGRRMESRIRSFLGENLDDSRSLRSVATVLCGGDSQSAATDYEYDGQEDCLSAAALYGGPKRCKDACLGFGACARACPLGAIRIEDRLAKVDADICTGCGKCLAACPRSLLALKLEGEVWHVACSSRRGSEAKAADCAKACIACGECVSASFQGEFKLEKNLASARQVGNGQWEAISLRCPTKAIVGRDERKKRRSSFRNVER